MISTQHYFYSFKGPKFSSLFSQRDVLIAISNGVIGVSQTLRTASVAETGTSNLLGDKQLVADIEADTRVMNALRECPAVAMASSEENPQDIILNTTSPNGGYSVAFDPLDGSSIIGADWAVGSIFGIYPGSGFINRTGKDLVAAAYAVHGPRTVLVIARPSSGVDTSNVIAQEFVLLEESWVLQRDKIQIADSKKVFAPANLRASAENSAYRELVQNWLRELYTLRYTGGMVPDVHHILAKGGGVFCNPASHAAPAKLRVLYECLPLAFCIEAAGGASLGPLGRGSMLEYKLLSHDDRSTICLGSRNEVEKCKAAMQA